MTRRRRLSWIALALVVLLTALAILMILPATRLALQGVLAPTAAGEHIEVRWIQQRDDHGELILTAALELENPGSKPARPLGADPDLVLETALGDWISPYTLPGERLPPGLREIAPGESWSGELGWWLDPDQRGEPLRLRWLDEELALGVDTAPAE